MDHRPRDPTAEPVEPSDEEAARAAIDDPAAFTTLYRRWAEPVYRYCARRLGSREAAEDATSQVFLRALSGISGFRGGSFPAWLFTIAHNVVASLARRPAERPATPIEDAWWLPDPAPLPEEQAIRSETIRSVRDALAVLTPDQRQVIELRLAGLTGPEIARVLGRSPDAVKMTQFRAMARLRGALAPERPATPPGDAPPIEFRLTQEYARGAR